MPSLVAFLSDMTYSDGSTRKTGTLMLMTEDGVWKAWLHERELGVGAFLTGATPDSLMASIDAALGGDKVPWRADKKATLPNLRK